jgi:hypothetical protein
MVFRKTYSTVDNNPNARAELSLEMVIMINNIPQGRIQGLRTNYNTGVGTVDEIGTDHAVEFTPGKKTYQGTIQSLIVKYGSLMQRIASAAGSPIDANSLSATISNLPEFDIHIMRRGQAQLGTPQPYAPASASQKLAGAGKPLYILQGCVIASGEFSINANQALMMESVSFQFIDMAPGTGDFSNAGTDTRFTSSGGTLFSGLPISA